MSMAKRPLLMLYLFAILLFLPYFAPHLFPVHDAAQSLNAFHTYYTALYFDHELPLWNPYTGYGLPAAGVMIYLSPFGYLWGLVGAFMGATDIVFLFKLVVLTELLVLLYGSYRLADRCLLSNESKFLVLGGVLLSFNWAHSLDANFHAHYLLPLILCKLLDFFDTGEARDLARAGIWSVLSCVGNAPYYAPLLLFIVAVFCLVMGVLKGWPHLRFSSRWLVGAESALVMGFAAIFLLYLSRNFGGLTQFSPGRDPQTGVVPFEMFRRYGGVIYPVKAAACYLTGTHWGGDVTLYVGLITLPLVAVATRRVNHPSGRAFMWLALVLVLFSWGGLVSWIGYHFPGMKFYRHIALVYGQIKILLFFIAGMALDAWLTGEKTTLSVKQRRVQLGVWLLVVGEVAALYLRKHAGLGILLYTKCPDSNGICWLPFMGRLLIYVLAAWLAPYRSKVVWVLVAFAIDLGSYQFLAQFYSPKGSEEQAVSLRKVYALTPPVFVPERLFAEEIERSTELGAWRRFFPGIFYGNAYAVLRADACVPDTRLDFLTPGVARLFSQYGYPFSNDLYKETVWRSDTKLLEAIGCHASKIRMDSGSAVVKAFHWNRVSIKTDSPHSTKLTYADAMFPGWSVRVDGTRADLSMTAAFKEVVLPAGSHEIDFQYWNGFTSVLQTLLSALSILAAVWLLLAAFLAGLGGVPTGGVALSRRGGNGL